MKTDKILKINGTVLDKEQLKKYLEKIASSHNIVKKSEKSTYPIPHLKESYNVIKEVYNLLNEHLKLKINIHPAGEWLLDNFYIIEQTVKQIEKELPLKKYKNLIGIANGGYKGFARIYVLASEIVAYTDNKIEKEELEEYLKSYQEKKTLNMEEIWNIGIFLQIALIENIREISEKIYISQMQKYRAENIVERLVENKNKQEQNFKENNIKKIRKENLQDMKYPFIEYMSYILKRYGKKGSRYLKSLEEIVEMNGTTISEVIKKEHFDIAVRKVSMGNSIISIKKIQRINFTEIFEKVNGVEEILKQDPSGVYEKMDYKTKEYYRAKIKEIAKKTKISEIYIARKVLALAKTKNFQNKESHIGYYLIDNGINELYNVLKYKNKKEKNSKKVRKYIFLISIITVILSLGMTYITKNITKNPYILFTLFLIYLVPMSEVVIELIQYILSKIVKPKLIPKLDLDNKINKENMTMVIIPTIVDSKEKVANLMKKLEVFYLANKSENIYFTLLGDCKEENEEEKEYDLEVIKEGRKKVNELNEKYKEAKEKIPLFNFIYRKRIKNEKEESYLGWERKRGLITQFNEYILGNIKNPFRENTIENKIQEGDKELRNNLKNIKYVITLDSDTDLILNSAFELIGAMAHILNKPVVNEEKQIVEQGYGIIQPRVGVDLDVSYKTIFTKIFAGAGGFDSYSNAISDTYQDNFEEGIFTGKGIYDLHVFSKILKNKIPENTVLSHDLLEGSYLRCGLASDILLMDGYPTKYNSYINRLSRWTRGDWQISKWLSKKTNLNLLSKFKIFDNLRRSILEIFIMLGIIYITILGLIYDKKIYPYILILSIVSIFPYLLEILNKLIFKKEGEKKQKTFTPKISGIKGSLYRGVITFGALPYKAYTLLKSIIKTIYRMNITKKHLLEWTTSEEAEKNSKTTIISYYNNMWINFLFGIVALGLGILKTNIFGMIVGILWIIMPSILWYISKEKKEEKSIDKITNKEKEYVLEIGKRTWEYFDKYLNEEFNYLIPDNYQEDRKEKVIKRTSSTNIGLSLLSVISAYDLKYIERKKAEELIKNIIESVESLQKWNGHLYNWYDIKTKNPLTPRYISTVDSGNFVGYLYVVKTFLIENDKNKELVKKVDKLIKNTDFSKLYNKDEEIFSIGFNIEENKLTDSYYDLLASEARQASLVAIAKKDVPAKHWNYLSRTLTTLGKYKGLISWSGTSFEYLMPNINIPRYKGSLLDESCKFMIKSGMEYAKELNLPWGISEAAFNLKDLHGNYQYKAFGIPWLGLKRGLADEQVVSSYRKCTCNIRCTKRRNKQFKKARKRRYVWQIWFL